MLRNGADKVVVNSSFIDNINLLKEIVNEFGSQSIICSIDYKFNKKMHYLYSHSATRKNNMNIIDYLRRLEDTGVGELLINSINNNGQKKGLDFSFLNKYRKFISCPIILSCGVNSPEHVLNAMKQKIEAVAIGNYLNYFEHSVILLKKYLKSKKKNDLIRLDTNIKYKFNNLDEGYRLKPKKDFVLKKMNKAF